MALNPNTVRCLGHSVNRDAAIDVAEHIAGMAFDATVVHRRGDERIAGKKIFESSVGINGVDYAWPALNGPGTLTNDGKGALRWVPTGGTGTVTAVDLAVPEEFVVLSRPVQSSGALTFGKAVQGSFTVFSGPAEGSRGVPGFRRLVADDIPVLSVAHVEGLGQQLAAKVEDRDAVHIDHDESVGGTKVFTSRITGFNSVPYFWPAENAAGILKNHGDGDLSWVKSGGGSVRRVEISPSPEFLTVGEPVTEEGSLAFEARPQPAHTAWMGPPDGGEGTPSFRALMTEDIPEIPIACVALLTTTLAGKANDSDAVHRAGAETIAGAKSFTSPQLAIGGVPYQWPTSPAAGVLTSDADGKLAFLPPRTVTSVNLAPPAEFVVTSGPVTDSGDLSFAFVPQDLATVCAGPATGDRAVPSFRKLTAEDIPMIPQGKVTNLLADLAAKARDYTVCHLDGAETVTGTKVFQDLAVGKFRLQDPPVVSGSWADGSALKSLRDALVAAGIIVDKTTH